MRLFVAYDKVLSERRECNMKPRLSTAGMGLGARWEVFA